MMMMVVVVVVVVVVIMMMVMKMTKEAMMMKITKEVMTSIVVTMTVMMNSGDIVPLKRTRFLRRSKGYIFLERPLIVSVVVVFFFQRHVDRIHCQLPHELFRWLCYIYYDGIYGFCARRERR